MEIISLVTSNTETNLTLYPSCIILQYAYKTTRCTKFLWLDFIINIRSTCFGLYQSIIRSNFISCTSHIPVYVGICDVQLIKLLLMMDWYSPKHVERILIIKSNHKNSVHLVGLHTYRNKCFTYVLKLRCSDYWNAKLYIKYGDSTMRRLCCERRYTTRQFL